MNCKYRVIEIFGSIDGEGKRTGQLTTFIRLAGCNLRCVYCDTTYSFDVSKAKEMSLEEILKEVQDINCHNITLTGGEPLIDREKAFNLIKTLCEKGYNVNVETNGAVDLTEYLLARNVYKWDLFFTVDYKTKFSGMNQKMNVNAFKYLDINRDIVKCVVANKEDMDDALHYLDSIGKFNIWFSPVFGEIKPVELVTYIKEKHREDITVQVQLHKIIWDVNTKGV